MKTFKAILIFIILSFSYLLAEIGFGISDVGTLSSMPSTEIISDSNLPINYFLDQNYPNPFNPSTKITFGLAKASFVNIVIFNALGQKVQVAINKKMDTGVHTFLFDAGNFSSGIYYYKIVAGDFQQVKKMLLVR